MIDPKCRMQAVFWLCLAYASSIPGCGNGDAGPASSGEGRYAQTDIAMLPHMIHGLKSKDPSTRARSAATIGGMGPAAKDAIPALITLLKDRDPSVRAAGAHALGRMGPVASKARPNLEALTKQTALREIATKAIRQITSSK
jgi:HEAT repeat protein